MGGFIRSLRGSVVSVLGTAVLAIGSTSTGAVMALADPVALIMGNSGRPWPEESYVANVMRRYIEPNSICGEVICEARNVYGPEDFWPVYGGLSALTFNQSTDEGLGYLDAALQQQLHDEPGEKVVIFGYSQSGRITNLELRNLADPDYAVGNDKIVPDADQLEIVLVGNWSRPNGGIGSRFNGITIPILDITFDGATPTDTGYQMTDISYEYDIISDAPLYPLNLLATANAALGFVYAHLTYADPSATGAAFPWGSSSEASFEELLASATVQKYPGKDDDPNGNPEDWDNTYVLIPSTHLPLLQPIRDIAAATGTSAFVEPVMLLIEPTLKVLIDTGYDRSIPMGQDTPARLIPSIDLVKLTADLVEAAGQGIQDAFGDGSSAPTVAPSSDAQLTTAEHTATPVASESDEVETVPPAKPSTRSKAAAADRVAASADDSTGATDAEKAGEPLRDVERGIREFADHVTNALRPPTSAAGTDTETQSDDKSENNKEPERQKSTAKSDRTEQQSGKDTDGAAA